MRLVSFKTLSVRNFLSVGDTPAVINFQSGVNVITGTNYDKEDSKNGVGKSTIVDALYFALFGSTIRELNKELIINSQTKKTCEVKLDFQTSSNGIVNNYQITRSISPTKCFITKDGVDITHSTMAKTNEFIQKLIRSTGKVFQNSVIMTINNTVPFMAQSKIDKRKFIESVLNLETFSDMLSKVREEYNDIKRDYEVIFNKNQTVEKSFKVSKEQLDLFEENKKTKIERIKNKIDDNNIKIDNANKEKVELPDNVDELLNNKLLSLNEDLKEIRNKYKSAFADVTVIKTNINNLQKELNNIDKVEASCRTCKRPFPENDINHKKQHIEDINNEITILKESEIKALAIANNISDLETNKENEINEINNKKTKINNIKSANNNIQSRILFLKDNNDELLVEKQNVLNETNSSLEQTVKDFEQEFINNKVQIEKLDKDLSVLECVKFVVSEEGVKSYIVRKILKVLNSRLAHYLEALQANCLCLFNEYFDETVTDETGVEKSYFNFSGGERKRIDLACLFAFLDIRRMQGDVHFSTIFYDELLDSSLDDKGVELVLKVLRDRSQNYNENCYIVTHRGTAITAKVDNTLFLEKRNGFTYIL